MPGLNARLPRIPASPHRVGPRPSADQASPTLATARFARPRPICCRRVVASGAAALRRSQRRYGVERLRPQQHDQQRPARRRHRVARDRLRGADNFAYRAIDVTTQTAKALIDRYYSDQPAFSYFLGCSMGGREAMMVTQKLPTYFDG